jgi:hypothetical protein
MKLAQQIIREPLFVFLAIGGLFYGVASLVRPPEPDEKKIVVDRAALLEFIQYRSKAFEPDVAAQILDGLSEPERESLIADFVREEVLFREAAALGLDAGDYVIKRRMIEKLDFVTESAVGAPAPTEDEISAWYDARKEDYAEPATATFTHVFFSREKRGAPAAEAAAEEMTLDLVKKRAPFEAATGKGDRFPFGVNYVERTYDYVASQFGDAAASAIFNGEGPFDVWRGPILSSYGAHAILVRKVTPARLPALPEIHDRVAGDVARDLRDRAKAALIEAAVARYDVRVELDPPPADAPAP